MGAISHILLKMKKGFQAINLKPLVLLVRPERFELPTPWFVAKYSIQMSYGRIYISMIQLAPNDTACL